MELLQFIVQAKQATYASDGDAVLLKDRGLELRFEDDNFFYIDRYYGFDPFIGQEKVWDKRNANEPVWGMNYFGRIDTDVTSRPPEEIYAFLKKALKLVSEEDPFRGPPIFEEEEMKYENEVTGNIDGFVGTERIRFCQLELYRLQFHGGLIKLKDW